MQLQKFGNGKFYKKFGTSLAGEIFALVGRVRTYLISFMVVRPVTPATHYSILCVCTSRKIKFAILKNESVHLKNCI